MGSFLQKSMAAACLTIMSAAGLNNVAQAQTPKSYTDYRKEVVAFPMGAASFVDRVYSARAGSRKPPKSERDPQAVLGEPDYKKSGDGRAYTLGCRGEVAFEFTDNAIIDGEGTDLYIFEVGADVEPTRVSLSNDGKTWVKIGQIAGGKTGIDLADYNLKGASFRFVRLQDTGKFCGGKWPGADIDAVGAIGSAIRLQLESRVLFEFDKATLKPAAGAALNKLIGKLAKLKYSRLEIAGHTDARGSDSYNQALSERRAKAVADYIANNADLGTARLTFSGRGESEPVQTNATDNGRAANRRVEVIVIPKP